MKKPVKKKLSKNARIILYVILAIIIVIILLSVGNISVSKKVRDFLGLEGELRSMWGSAGGSGAYCSKSSDDVPVYCEYCTQMCEAKTCVPSGKKICKGKCNFISDCYCSGSDDCAVDTGDKFKNRCIWSFCSNGLCEDGNKPDRDPCEISKDSGGKSVVSRECCQGTCCAKGAVCMGAAGCISPNSCVDYTGLTKKEQEELAAAAGANKPAGCSLKITLYNPKPNVYGIMICLKCYF